MTAMPEGIPIPPVPILNKIAVTLVRIVGIHPNINPVTLIRMDRVSYTNPGFNVKGKFMMTTQVPARTTPVIHGFSFRCLGANKFVASYATDMISKSAILLNKVMISVFPIVTFPSPPFIRYFTRNPIGTFT
ncbi:hypothetical protein SDC9_133372 [bioreactor metagenome]|uniref:Uncharacterized protein n=1 Tax=bioreactor metagenome TaxID=1076179 RepID=A0A645DBG3_9ZZZZ